MALLPTNIATGNSSHIAYTNQVNKKTNAWVDVVADYGAVGDGTTDDSAAIAAAIAALPALGGTVTFPPGTFVTDPIVVPDYPKTVHLEGAGPWTTLLQPRLVNNPVLKGAANVVFGFAIAKNTVKNLGIKAHASGSTGMAVDMRNMSWHLFDNIAFFDNGTGKFAQGFFISDVGGHCYSNTLRRILVHGQKGPTSLVRAEGTAYLQMFEKFHASYDLTATGIKVFDFADTLYHYIIKDCHFEGITGTAIIPTLFTVVDSCYFEGLTAAIDGTGRTNNNVTIIGCNFGAGATVPNTDRYTFIGCQGGDQNLFMRNPTGQKFTMEADSGNVAQLALSQSGVRGWYVQNEATTGRLVFNDGGALDLVIDATQADGETALLVRRNIGGAFALSRVTMGPTDSGGSGFRYLRVAN